MNKILTSIGAFFGFGLSKVEKATRTAKREVNTASTDVHSAETALKRAHKAKAAIIEKEIQAIGAAVVEETKEQACREKCAEKKISTIKAAFDNVIASLLAAIERAKKSRAAEISKVENELAAERRALETDTTAAAKAIEALLSEKA